MNLPATTRLEFRRWREEDLPLAVQLWGDAEVMRYIDVRGGLSDEQLRAKLQLEFGYARDFGTQYWPIFEKDNGDFVGCCGLKPWVHSPRQGFELGFHVIKAKWGRGYAPEAAEGVIDFARNDLKQSRLLAGHHPENSQSKKILESLGFVFLEHVFFKPTGLMHLSYELKL
jgi:[ribosomal protein S5]-alanine N-acetyltransferase